MGQIQHFNRLLKRVGLECAQQYAAKVKLALAENGLPVVPTFSEEVAFGKSTFIAVPASNPVEGTDVSFAAQPQSPPETPPKAPEQAPIVRGVFGEAVGTPEIAAPVVDNRPRGTFGEIIGGDDTPFPAAPAPEDPNFCNGWPVLTEGTIWTLCPNPRLAVMHLPDGRTASVYRDALPPNCIGVRIHAELRKKLGDPIYAMVRMHEIQGEMAKVG